MSDSVETKSKTDYLRDVTSQLKEMRHYAQTNTETLSSHWLAFDAGEYKDKEFAGRIDALLNKQGTLLDDLDAAIQDMEIAVNHSEQEK
ncbi:MULTISPECIES: hypothetical protein [Pantoea]|jgi:hypothetical protein|uniref:Uncharacterized protein n=1 Tax=Pantoea piersonii TaxID=2364647 RepID=A0AAJ5QNB9_9GAMM|nr:MULTISPECIES: hypothetical protein [Pantoea]MDU6434509.1 hypothetical protein [Pantoea sp.]MBZ6385562.1 hypothetical protein [Pantoea piersonii]MBZ6398894.1 hypothetical protein [Pantoea piersonii]MBZ6407608.1 hypothetical protein [Pantoea piersonii]MBZ6425441.1 hypothetical protein [Pantoea piersonii]